MQNIISVSILQQDNLIYRIWRDKVQFKSLFFSLAYLLLPKSRKILQRKQNAIVPSGIEGTIVFPPNKNTVGLKWISTVDRSAHSPRILGRASGCRWPWEARCVQPAPRWGWEDDSSYLLAKIKEREGEIPEEKGKRVSTTVGTPVPNVQITHHL